MQIGFELNSDQSNRWETRSADIWENRSYVNFGTNCRSSLSEATWRHSMIPVKIWDEAV